MTRRQQLEKQIRILQNGIDARRTELEQLTQIKHGSVVRTNTGDLRIVLEVKEFRDKVRQLSENTELIAVDEHGRITLRGSGKAFQGVYGDPIGQIFP